MVKGFFASVEKLTVHTRTVESIEVKLDVFGGYATDKHRSDQSDLGVANMGANGIYLD